jgi:hypothetical protein
VTDKLTRNSCQEHGVGKGTGQQGEGPVGTIPDSAISMARRPMAV